MTSYTVSDFYKDELSRLNDKQTNANSILNTQDRLAKLNEGYRKRHAKFVEIITVLILAFILRLVVVFLQRQIPIIPEIIVNIITILLIFYLAYYLLSSYLELSSRSLINYDELELPPYDSSGVDLSKLEEKGMVFKKTENAIDVCVGEECCPGNFDPITKRCIVTVGTSSPQTPPQTSSVAGFTLLEHVSKSEKLSGVKPIECVTSLNYSIV